MTRNKHDWHRHNDGTAFLCMKCGKQFDRTRDKPFPSDSDKCKGRPKR